MQIPDLQAWALQNPWMAAAAALGLALLAFLFTRLVVAHALVTFVARTKTSRDGIFVKHLRPYRVAWIAPLLVIYALAPFFPEQKKWSMLRQG